MKKSVFFVFLAIAIVLFTFNLASADDKDASATINETGDVSSLTKKECRELAGKPIPANAEEEIREVTTESFMLTPGIYWISKKGTKKIQTVCPEGTVFMDISPGTYKMSKVPLNYFSNQR